MRKMVSVTKEKYEKGRYGVVVEVGRRLREETLRTYNGIEAGICAASRVEEDYQMGHC